MKNYSSVASPFTALTSPSLSFRWTPETEAAFSELKHQFISSPILTHPDQSLQFIVEVDMSDTGVVATNCIPVPFSLINLTPQNGTMMSGTEHPFIVWADRKNLSIHPDGKQGWPYS